MKIRPESIITLVCMLCTGMLIAQMDIRHFTKYNTLDGLNHNHITTITQDSLGFIWIGTENGPMRFDGTTFVPLSALNPGYANKEPFTSNLTTLNKNQLGISTTYGAHILDISNYQFRTLQFPVEDDLTTWAYNTFDIGVDKNGNYGVSTKTGFYVFNPDHQLIQSKYIYSSADIGTSWMLYGRKIITTPEGDMLQKNSRGFNLYDAKSNVIIQNPNVHTLDTSLMQRDDEIQVLFPDPETIVYFSTTTKSLYLHDLETGKVSVYPVLPEMKMNLNWYSRLVVRNDSTMMLNGKTGIYMVKFLKDPKQLIILPELQLPGIEVSALFADRDGRLWMGTYSGLYKENTSVPVERFDITLPGKDGPLHIKWMEKGTGVWYASAMMDGLLTLDDRNYTILDHIVFTYNNETLRIGKMLRYDANHLWICSTRGIIEYTIDSKNYSFLTYKNCPDCNDYRPSHEIHRDKAGDIWITGNEGNRVYQIDAKTGNAHVIEHSTENPKFRVNSVYRFTEDADGNIWFCGDAMARYNKKERVVDSLIEKLPLQQISRKVFLMFSNSLGEQWFSTTGENWHVYHPKNGFSILEDDKLSPDLNKYQTMLGDELYYMSREGKIVVLHTLTRKWRILSAQDGWDQEMMSSFGFFPDPSSGYVVFTGDNVVYRFKPETPGSLPIRTPFVSEVNVLGRRLIHHPQGKLVFDADEQTMQIKFLTLNYDDPSNQLYEYRLKENDQSTWIAIDKPEIILNQIPSGHYNLELKVSSKNNDWLPVYKSYPLTIRFPFYREWWFIVLAFIFVATGIWVLIRYRLKQMKFISGLDRQVIEYELKALHAQMNPHFVFNCLNSIKEMIMSKDNKNANIYLNKFSYLLRSTLEQSKLSFVPLSHTIEYLQHYLEMEKLRFSYFNYIIEVKEGMETDNIVVAPLLLQPIVENAIWHGQSEGNGSNQLCVRFYDNGEDMVCEVEDYGVGINATRSAQKNGTHVSSALENIGKRIELLNRKHAVDYRLLIEDKSDLQRGCGTIVKLMFKHREYEFN